MRLCSREQLQFYIIWIKLINTSKALVFNLLSLGGPPHPLFWNNFRRFTTKCQYNLISTNNQIESNYSAPWSTPSHPTTTPSPPVCPPVNLNQHDDAVTVKCGETTGRVWTFILASFLFWQDTAAEAIDQQPAGAATEDWLIAYYRVNFYVIIVQH